ncbi:uncharacterized protein [Ptychodera flava]|uniref:uncharacterized protein n=1 Tax=Ptychodera flava TaxID=63121 RepID=UPI003969E9A9
MSENAESTSKAAALFVFHTWNKDKYGLPATHRLLVKDFCHRKSGVMEVYSTTLDLKLSKEQKKDADDIGVNLIVAERKKWADEKHDPAVLRWLLDHEVHYPGLKDLENIEYVIGYTPETHCAAADIQERLFPKAKLVLINYATASKDEEDEKFDEQMLEASSAAEVLFSLGPLTHKHFENEYQTEHNKKKLYEIPHLEIAPLPCIYCSRENIPEENISEPVLFTYGQINDEEALKRCGPIAAAIGKFSETWEMRGTVTWKIQGVSEKEEMKKRSHEFFTEILKGTCTKFRLYSNCSIGKLARHLLQSHLCVPLPSIDESCFDGVEAMFSTVPVVSMKDTHLAHFIDKYFKEHMDSCIVGKAPEQLTERLQKVCRNIPLAFENAKRLKQDYANSEEVLDTYAEFAALLTPHDPTSSKDNTGGTCLEIVCCLQQDTRQNDIDEEETARQDAIWNAFLSSLDEVIDALLASEEKRQQLQQVIENKCGSVRVSSIEKGSLVVTLDVPRLINLYRLERTTKSGSLAEAMEPLLIPKDIKVAAERAGIPENLMKLQVIYDKRTFQAIAGFLIKRDGGNISQLGSSDNEIEEVSDDEIQYEPEMKEDLYMGSNVSGSVRECEKCSQLKQECHYLKEERRNLVENNQRELRRHAEMEQSFRKKLTSQYSRIKQLEQTVSDLTPSKNITSKIKQSKGELIRFEWKVKTFGDAEDPVLLNYPCGVIFSGKNHLVLCDRNNFRVDIIDMVSKRVSFLKFDGKFDRPFRPQDVAISADNLLFITDRKNRQIVVSDEDSKEVRTFGHKQVKFEPFGIALMGNYAIVSDTAGHRILKYTTEGQYVREVGGYGKGDGQFDEPYSVVVNSQNQILATDFHNHRVQVFDSDLKFLYSFGTNGSLPGQLQNPYGINVDSDDNVYVCDFDNHRVAKFTKEGKFECNLFESDVNYPMYVAVSKGKADQFKIAVSQWQDDKIKVFLPVIDK